MASKYSEFIVVQLNHQHIFNNAKVHGLVNIGTNQFSAYPLVPGVDVLHDYLKNLLDVNIPSPANNDVLTFDSATSKWVAGAPASQVLESIVEQAITANTLTTLFTFSPTATTNLAARVSISLPPTATAGTLSTLSLTWTDPQAGSQTYNWIGSNGISVNPGNNYTFPTAFITDFAASGVAVKVQSTVAVYANADLIQG